MKEPTFSIVIPTLNEEKFLPRLLDSLIAQTDQDFEAIVVDGASRDKTLEVVKRYAKKMRNLRSITSARANTSLQRNLGAAQSTGKWIVFVDADGEFMPYFVNRCARYVHSHNAHLFTTWWLADSEVSGDALLALVANVTMELSLVFHRPHAPGPLTIISREAFDRVGGYDESHSFTEDLDLGLRLGKAGYEPSMLREALYVWSLRRLRNEGTLRVLQAYAKAGAMALVVQRAPKFMPGYITGGHLYGKKRTRVKRPLLRQYEKKLKKLMRELFE